MLWYLFLTAALSFKKGFSTRTLTEFGREPLLLVLKFQLNAGHPQSVKPQDSHPVTGLTVKSVISSPSDGATLKAAAIQIHGVAWAGEADVVKVEISTDGGNSWNPARLGSEQARYAWRLWSYDWKPPKSGDYVIMSRASDSQGRTQPAAAVWNPSGYLYNTIDQVKIHVAA